MSKKLLCLDFDGVIHSYSSGWQGPTIIPDLPVPGSIEFIRAAVRRFEVSIFSSRSRHDGGIEAMKNWLNFHGLPHEWICDNLNFPTDKPPASVILDDRAIQFTGLFPSLDEIDSFQPWTRFVKPDAVMTGTEEGRLAAEILVILLSRQSLKPEVTLPALGIAAGAMLLACASKPASVAPLTEWFTATLKKSVNNLANHASLNDLTRDNPQ